MKILVIFLLCCSYILGKNAVVAVVGGKASAHEILKIVEPKRTNGLKNEDNALEIDVNPIGGPSTHGILGISLPASVGQWQNCSVDDPDVTSCVDWGDFAQVIIRPSTKNADRCTRVEWTSSYARELQDCYDMDPQVHWYGGGEMYTQIWPIETRPRLEQPYITMDMLANYEGEFGGVVENYWLLSSGAALLVDPDIPLFFSLNSTHKNRVCFTARDQAPYHKRSPLTLKYEWCVGTDVKEIHQLVRNTFFELPLQIPDEEMMIRPLWSTWAEYKADINQTIVLEYARKVVSEGFGNSSHIEIDDLWEPCYGAEEFDTVKFPDPKAMIDEIKGMNMRATAWVTPFINYGCPIFEEAFDKGYFVKTPRGKAGITWWWEGLNSGIIDATNPEAVKWWTDRLRKLQADTGLDSFKFDAGETNWLPSSPSLTGDDTDWWPQLYSTKYVEACATFGNMIETRTAHLNHKEAVFVRMEDKDSRWGYDNGLKSMIPTLFQIGIVGYPFVLPDMIGGNAYSDGMPSKELYLRWMQVNIFMPSVQFSIVPWNYDAETVRICLEVLAHREKYRDEIITAARQSLVDGSPVNRPLWWVDPTDVETLTIDDAYMLGDNILVAPVVEQGAVTRDIYLPTGNWKSGVDSTEYQGRQWLRNYPAPLNVVPFFVKSS